MGKSTTCQCLYLPPLVEFADLPHLGPSSCLNITLQGGDLGGTSTAFPVTACVDPVAFGVGCDAHWTSLFGQHNLDAADEEWYHKPWCFVGAHCLLDSHSKTIEISLETDATKNSTTTGVLSYSACSGKGQDKTNRKHLRRNRIARFKGRSPSHRTSTCAGTLGWEFAGPTTYVQQFGDGPKLASAGAVQDVVEGVKGTWFIASVNGGVWRSTSLDQERPHWENVLDGQPVTCSSMSALHVSKSNPNTVYAGCGGSTSSEQGYNWNVINSGDWGGIMTSSDGGDTWHMMGSFPVNYYVTDILEVDQTVGDSILLVSAQSHLFDRDNGGIWRSIDGGVSFLQVDKNPTFTLTHLQEGILATHARSSEHSISISKNGGESFEDFGSLPWDQGAEPFYTCATELGDGRSVAAGLTRLVDSQGRSAPNNTDSQFFVSDIKKRSWAKFGQPTRMDEDSMPKDRMALLADPKLEDLMYVAGNAGALAWRVNVTTGTWTKMWDKPDVLDGSIPHGDCRNYAWDSINDRLLLVTDGGIFAREKPRGPGGRWVSLNGDYASLELLSAKYDPQDGRFVAGAQDNCAIVTKANATASDIGYGFVEGDGTVSFVDSTAKPSRLFGTTQFLGVGTIENDPTLHQSAEDDDDDDDDCGGLCFVQGGKFIEVEVDKYFPEPSSFPFFVHPYVLNRQDPTLLHFWTNGTGPERPSAFYQFNIPHSVRDKDDIGAPTKLLETPPGAMIMDLVSGGYTSGEADPTLIIALSNTHLYVRSVKGEEGEHGTMIERPLPVAFAAPVTLDYDKNNGARILGPLTHAKTLSFAISPSDSKVIAVTGWPTIESNLGDEVVFLTTDTGKTWQNVTGNIRTASGVLGKVRPGGLLLVDLLDDDNTRALLVGTSNGILTTFVTSSPINHAEQQWVRFGTREEFPLVLTADVDYESISDRLVAATFGRGIHVLKDAKRKLLKVRKCMLQGVGPTLSTH